MLLDNKKNGKVGESLKEILHRDYLLSIATSSFSLFAFNALKKEITQTKRIRLLLSEMDATESSSFLNDYSSFTGGRFERPFRNQLGQKKIAKECSEWLLKNSDIRGLNPGHSVGQKLYLTENPEGLTRAIQGSSDFTMSGMGYAESETHDMNMRIDDPESSQRLLEWFDSIWDNSVATRDVSEQFIQKLNGYTNTRTPEFVYFQVLYNIFKEFLHELDEENIIKSKTGFKDTLVWNKLYRFQRDGVLGAIDKLERYNGCIIADSVGLGKTFEALAVIKYYELRNDRILVLCPKKLRENWTIYTVNDKRNILAGDRFNYDVLNHTDLTRLRGKSGEINLETINWGNYDLVVIDESHNFRNNNPKKDGITRYSRLMDQIIRSGVKTKVLMLSATPVNNRMNDLKNQIAFITEGVDNAFMDQGIASLEQSLRKAQIQFNRWLNIPNEERTLETLLESMSFDYFKLLDLLTIARSRKHIEKYYDITEIGKFPERLKPQNIKEDIDLEGDYPPLKEVNKSIRLLNLAAYAPLKYVRMEKREEYNRKYDTKLNDGASVFRHVDREQSLIHLMRVNLLKRMESSINSFSLTVEKLVVKVEMLIRKIEEHDGSEIEELSIEDIDVDDDEFEPFLIGQKVKVLLSDIDEVRWLQDLREDRDKLQGLLDDSRKIDEARDAKLARLKSLISEKITNPINDGNKKILIFTAFADTANYLYDDIAKWARNTLGVHSALVTGSGPNRSTLDSVRTDINSLLTAFSPISKERHMIEPDATEGIDILIATDCISEGQNLQDCDYLVNYDIHWNPVRIIQRFGRVDRLGSKNDVIQLVNFWPNMELDEYINLEARVSGRMVLLDISATGEENIIEYDEKRKMNDLDYRRQQLKQLQDAVVDLEDVTGGVSITDLTLNDFRMDLSNYLKGNQDSLESAPWGLYAVTNDGEGLGESDVEPGVLFCLRSMSSKVVVDDSNGLAPYYLVYVTDSGAIKFPYTQSKKSLDILKKLGSDNKVPNETAISLFDSDTRNGSDMSHYQALLEVAVSSIIGRSEEKGVESLFSRGGTILSKDTFRGIDDFEVISYLIIVGKATNL